MTQAYVNIYLYINSTSGHSIQIKYPSSIFVQITRKWWLVKITPAKDVKVSFKSVIILKKVLFSSNNTVPNRKF